MQESELEKAIFECVCKCHILARQQLVEVLVAHQRHTYAACLCGWSVLGASHSEHVADVFFSDSLGEDIKQEKEEARGFKQELAAVINKYSMERGSNTPDFILADYLADCLAAYEHMLGSKNLWYGVDKNG